MEHKRYSTTKQHARRDPESLKTAIGSLARELWREKRNVLDPAEVEWLVDGRLMAQLDELSKNELSRVEKLLARNVKPNGKRYMTGSPV